MLAPGELFDQILRDQPEMASALLLALAVERKVLPEGEAEALAEGIGLADPRGVAGALALRVERQGRTGELAALLQELRRIQGRAEKLLRRYSR